MRPCRHFNFECLESDRVQSRPQRLKPQLHLHLYGTSELVPFHKAHSRCLPGSYSFAPTALFAVRFCGMILPPWLKR